MEFASIQYKSMPDMVIGQVIEKIVDRELKVGDRLPTEAELIDAMGIGRSTVREALKALEVLGVISRSKTGTVVENPDSGVMVRLMQCFISLKSIDLKQLLDLRIILEPEFIKQAVVNATDADIENLKKMAIRDSDDSVSKVNNTSFHEYIAKLSGNVVYQLFFEMLYPSLSYLQEISIKSEMAIGGFNIEHHLEIIEAIKNRDSEKASSIMRMHLMTLRNEI